MKNIKLVFLMVFLYSLGYGQNSKFAIGFNFTPSSTSLKGNFKPPIDLRDVTVYYSNQFEFSTGLSIEYFFDNRYSLKSGLIYERKGAQSDPLHFQHDIYKKMNFDYLTLPLLGSISTKGKIKFYIDGGVYMGFLLSQKDVYTLSDNRQQIKVDRYDEVTKLDFGMSLGLGLRIPLSKKLLLDFGLCYTNGLININKTYLPNNAVLRTGSMGFQISLKYQF